MPLDEKGKVYLTFWHGVFVWICVGIYMSFWAAMGMLLYWCGYETTGKVVAILGESSFGVVPMYFFTKEENRCRNGG